MDVSVFRITQTFKCEAEMLIREVLLFTGLEVLTELLQDSAAARGICRRESVGTIRHLSTKVLWLQQLMNRGVVMVGACSSAENRADMGQSHCLPTDCTSCDNGAAWCWTEMRDWQLVTERMVRMISKCELSPILGKATEESWTHWGTCCKLFVRRSEYRHTDARWNTASG